MKPCSHCHGLNPRTRLYRHMLLGQRFLCPACVQVLGDMGMDWKPA